MQQRAMVLTFALLAAQWATVASLSATNEARLFLRSHIKNPPQPDELAELKGENPEAYALVKALLTKRSLGLLNSRHPTASFAAPAADQMPEAEKGPEAFAKFASPGEISAAHTPQVSALGVTAEVAVPYANVQTAHHDWLNWKPSASAMSDEQMVQNVLGAVAGLKGSKAGLLSKQRTVDENPLAADAASMDSEPEAPVAAPKPVAAAPEPAPKENSYLKTIDFGLDNKETQAAAAPPAHENSYLKGLDLSGDMPTVVATPESSKKAAQVQSSSTNSLSSFSWDDAPQEEARAQPKELVQVPESTGGSTLLSWLGVQRKAPAQKVVAAAPAKPSNPYLVDLS